MTHENPTIEHGTLTGSQEDGTTWAYTGEIVNGKAHGKGESVYENGASYVGEYQNGNFHGYGKCTFPYGDVYEGYWKDGKFVV